MRDVAHPVVIVLKVKQLTKLVFKKSWLLVISPQEAKRVAVAALFCAQVPISTIARQEKVGRA